MKTLAIRLVTALIVGFAISAPLTDVLAASAEDIIDGSQRAFHYAGADAKGKLKMELIDSSGAKRVRVLTMLRRNQDQGNSQKYFMYFHEPNDVRRLTFMVWKEAKREDDRWIFVPAIDLIRRIAAEDKYSSFVGSDFNYEDVSGRDVEEDTHTLLREEPINDRDAFVIESIPRAPAVFTKRVSWIDKKTLLPLKEEYYDAQGDLQRIFTADEIKDIAAGESGAGAAYPTITKRTMKNVKTGHRTEVTVESVVYDLGLEDADFSERRMRRPPQSWIR